MAQFDPQVENDIESKLVAVNKADMKLHLAKLELRDVICEALCSVLPRYAEIDDILDAARELRVYKILNKQERNAIVKIVYEQLNK